MLTIDLLCVCVYIPWPKQECYAGTNDTDSYILSHSST